MSFLIKSDAFSAIIKVAAFVLPEGIVGIIEASATLKFSTPFNFRFESTTASLSIPILQLPIA